MEKPNFSKNNSTNIDSEVIELKDFFDFYLRNRLLISSFTIVFFLLSIIRFGNFINCF